MASSVKSPISRALCAFSLVAATVVAGASAAPGAETKRKPWVGLTNEQPVVVTGRGFAARERVAVKVAIGSSVFARGVRATLLGTFRVTIADASAHCRAYSVSAVGRAGSRAVQTRRFEIPPPCGIELAP